MRVFHGFAAEFDDPNLVSCAGLAPVLWLAEGAGLGGLVAEHVRIDRPGGSSAGLKVCSLVAGMVAGADSIDDMALLRHGGMDRLFTGVRAPSTLGTFLRAFTFGHVRQLDAVASRLLVNLARRAPLLPGAGELAYVDGRELKGLLPRSVTTNALILRGWAGRCHLSKPYAKEFREDVVRVARNHGTDVGRGQIASDFEIHFTTLYSWWLKRSDSRTESGREPRRSSRQSCTRRGGGSGPSSRR